MARTSHIRFLVKKEDQMVDMQITVGKGERKDVHNG